jgi:hypothetical protein
MIKVMQTIDTATFVSVKRQKTLCCISTFEIFAQQSVAFMVINCCEQWKASSSGFFI